MVWRLFQAILGSKQSSSRGGSVESTTTHSPKAETTDYAGVNTICRICCNNGSEVKIPKGKVTSRCPDKADRQVCERCLERHVREAINKGDFSRIRCICQDGCKVMLGHADVKAHADTESFQAYDTGLLRAALEKEPEFRWCSRRGCGSGQLHVNQHDYPRMRCHACRSCTCFTHNCPWHSGRTCRQYDRDATKSDEVALLQLLETGKFKRCPQCTTGIEKKGGCDHMTCRRDKGGCGAEFCWLCLADYKGPQGIWKLGNKAHKKTCSHYADRK